MIQTEFYLATENISGHPGDGSHINIEILKGDVLIRDENTYFDQYSIEFIFYKDNKHVTLNRERRYFGLPSGFEKINFI